MNLKSRLRRMLPFATLFCLTARAAENPVTPKLLGRWDFEETGGTTVLDSSGNGLNGIVHNVTRGKGRVGNALTFSGQDSYVAFEHCPLSLGSEFTIAFWVKTLSAEMSNKQVIISKGPLAKGHFEIYIQKADGLLHFFSPDIGDVGVGVVNDKAWHHLAVTYDRQGAMKFYMDGGPAIYSFDSVSYPLTGAVARTISELRLGSLIDGTLPFSGSIDDLRFYDGALTQEGIDKYLAACPKLPMPVASSFIPNAPLIIDRVWNSAKDATLCWNRNEQTWWYFCMQMRNGLGLPGVKFCHGSTIGIYSSADGCRTWRHRGIMEGLEFEPGLNTFWAPNVFWDNGKYHLFITYVKGQPVNFSGDRHLIHYTSDDLTHWHKEAVLKSLGDKSLDCEVYKKPNGKWGIWYKDESTGLTGIGESPTLDGDHWTKKGSLPHNIEGPDCFSWKGYYWLIGDDIGAGYRGLLVYRSTDCETWTRVNNILSEPGNRPGDGGPAHHGEVVIANDIAYIFYWVKQGDFLTDIATERCYTQAAQLEFDGTQLTCDRNRKFELRIQNPLSEVKKISK